MRTRMRRTIVALVLGSIVMVTGARSSEAMVCEDCYRYDSGNIPDISGPWPW